MAFAAATVLGVSGSMPEIARAGAEGLSAGEKWTDAAEVRIVDDELLAALIDKRADGESKVTYSGSTWTAKRETYNPADRQWQGLVSVAAVGDRLWSCFYTGGKKEPDPFNYIVMAYSDDGGKSWVDPYRIVDHADIGSQNIFTVVPNLFVDEDGDLWLTYLQSQFWGIRFDNAGCENIKDLAWDPPKVLGNMKTNQPPTVITHADGSKEWIVASESQVGESHVDTTRLYGSKDKGATWTLKAKVKSGAATARRWPESQVVQVDDQGTLLLASRLEGGTVGGVEVAVSKDYGTTWSDYEYNLSKPFIGPGSKFFMLRLSSGNLLMLNHDTSSSRSKLKAYLSEDGGKTWPYSLSLDDRDDVSYPSAFEADGRIFAAWDKGRYIEKELRFSSFDEEDIKKGYILSENGVKKSLISRPTQYRDVSDVLGAFPSYLEKPVGTASAEIKAELPSRFSVLDEDGKEYTLQGAWSSAGYKAERAGYYLLAFEAENMPLYLADGADKLSIVVRLVEGGQQGSDESSGNENGGNGGCKSSSTAGTGVAAAVLAAAGMKRKGKRR